jgi:hypothetical protein
MALIDAAVKSARTGPVPGPEILMSDVYVEY